MKKHGLLVFWILTFVGIVLLSFISGRMFNHQCNSEIIRKTGVIRFGISLRPPFSYLASDSTPTGVSVETARMVAERLGIKKHEFQTRSFDSLLDWLNLNDFDVMVEVMFATPERADKADFSIPYLKLVTSLLVKKGNPLNLRSYADVVRSNARVMVFKGSFQEKWATEKIPATRLLKCLDFEHSVLAFERDEVDVYLTAGPAGQETIKKASIPLDQVVPTDKIYTTMPQPIPVCFAVAKGQQQLLEQWNRALHQVVKSPEYSAMLIKYGFSPQDLP